MTTRAEFLAGVRGEMAKTRGLFRHASAAARPSREAAEVVRRAARRALATGARAVPRGSSSAVAGVFHRVPSPGRGAGRHRAASPPSTGAREVVGWEAGALGLGSSASAVRRGA
mgnify:CR=1 FL=1